MHSKPILFLIPSNYINLMLVLAEPDETRKKLVPKKGFFHIVMNLDNGIQKINAQNYGTYSMENIIKENIFEYFPRVTGQKSMFGNIF